MEAAENERERRRHEHDVRHGKPEMVEAVPEPRQPLPVQKDHEIRQEWIPVDASRPDLAHQIHAHRVAAEREEGGMSDPDLGLPRPDDAARRDVAAPEALRIESGGAREGGQGSQAS